MQASAFLKCWISTWTLSRSYKEYIDGPTIAELIHDSISVAGYLPQVRDMAAKAQNCGLNIDYYPTNFVVSGGLLWYIDYECNDYMPEWDFEHWGIRHWLPAIEFRPYREEDFDAVSHVRIRMKAIKR